MMVVVKLVVGWLDGLIVRAIDGDDGRPADGRPGEEDRQDQPERFDAPEPL